MQKFVSSPKEMVASFWRNRGLIFALTQREVLGRYRGSFVGIFWPFFNPVFMLVVYTFVFSVVFNARWNSGGDSRAEFALVLFAGLLIFNLFAECVSRSTSLILSNVNYVKKVVFPLEILPWVSLGGALFHFGISLGVWLVAYTIFFGMPHATVLLLPLILIPFVIFLIGLTLFLSALGVFLRDVSQLVGILITVFMFLSPIFYPASALPLKYQGLFMLNPLTPIIEMTRDVLYWGKTPSFILLGLCYLISILVACIGFSWFQKTRKGFADVL
jgi:lipopolysaccharide transport system permease protein